MKWVGIVSWLYCRSLLWFDSFGQSKLFCMPDWWNNYMLTQDDMHGFFSWSMLNSTQCTHYHMGFETRSARGSVVDDLRLLRVICAVILLWSDPGSRYQQPEGFHVKYAGIVKRLSRIEYWILLRGFDSALILNLSFFTCRLKKWFYARSRWHTCMDFSSPCDPCWNRPSVPVLIEIKMAVIISKCSWYYGRRPT